MSRKSRMSLSAVEKLVDQRRLFQDWMAKLADGVDGMPPHVVERVRNDYRARLDSVVGELGEHADSLRDALDEAQLRYDGLDAQQQAKKDELAELRLRRHVGEMDDAAFKEQSAEMKAGLEGIQKELAAAQKDIERYREILATITSEQASAVVAEPGEPEVEEPEPAAPPVAAVPAAPAPRVEPPRPQPRVEPPQAEPVRAEAPRDERPSSPDVAPARGGVDELAFLRSVTSRPIDASKVAQAVRPREEKPAPREREERPAAPREAPRREEPAAPAAEAHPASAATETADVFDAAPNLLQLPVSEHDAPAPAPAARPSGREEGAALVCGECGAKNRPTEWYCEKCGAELAAL